MSTNMTAPGACELCRRWKMKCTGADIAAGLPCQRCERAGSNCIFTKSRRGRRKSPTDGPRPRQRAVLIDLRQQPASPPRSPPRDFRQNKYALSSSILLPPPSSRQPLPSVQLQPPDGAAPLLPRTDGASVNDRFTCTDALLRRRISSPYPRGGLLATTTGIIPHPTSVDRSQDCSGSYEDDIDVDDGRGSGSLSGINTLLPDSPLNPHGMLVEAGTVPSDIHHNLDDHLDASTDDDNDDLDERQDHETQAHPSRYSAFREPGGRQGHAHCAPGLASTNRTPGHSSYYETLVHDPRHGQLVKNLLTAQQLNDLFEIWYTGFHPQLPILDPTLHTVEGVQTRSDFLLAVIAVTTARQSMLSIDLQKTLAALVKDMTMEYCWNGQKSIEAVQAFLIMANYPLELAKRYELAKNWHYLGLALRMATDLNLFRQIPGEPLNTDRARFRAREILNRERTWLVCFIMDRSMSAQMGKPWSIQEDQIIRDCFRPAWYQGEFCQKGDMFIASYAQTLRIFSRALDTLYCSHSFSVSGLVDNLNYPMLLNSFSIEINRSIQTCLERTDESDDNYRRYTQYTSFHSCYYNLVLESFGLQHALERSPAEIPIYLNKVHSTVLDTMTIWIERMVTGESPAFFAEGGLVMISYVVLSGLKLLRPNLARHVSDPWTILRKAELIANLMVEESFGDEHLLRHYGLLLKRSIEQKKAGIISADHPTVHQRTANLAMGAGTVGGHDPSAATELPLSGPMSGRRSVAASLDDRTTGEIMNWNGNETLFGCPTDFNFPVRSDELLAEGWMDFATPTLNGSLIELANAYQLPFGVDDFTQY